jgi:hydrogenase maturation protein HypF
MPAARTAVAVRVTGVVQGVGFRPFVHRLAAELHLDGLVGNDERGVFAELEGSSFEIDQLISRLSSDAPPLAVVESVQVASAAPCGRHGFSIVESREASPDTVEITSVSPDTAVCDACVAELWDPGNRRYLHPFITCTDCGPRFTITRRLPYDRPNTTLASFALCASCRAEYTDPADRRYHAQPIGCHECGPTLSFRLADGPVVPPADALMAAREALRSGAILAVKGIGGYHLVCDATLEAAVASLRQRKGRPDKPLAVMVADLTQAHALADLDGDDVELLASPARPIVLVPHRTNSGLSRLVAPDTSLLGIMLPYAPVQHLLFRDPGPDHPVTVLGPLVMTSSNRSGEPIVYRDDDLDEAVGHIVDGVLSHDRPIHVPCDDSVLRVSDGHLMPIRRSRGYAPLPLRLPLTGGDVLAVGAELKNTFCVGRAGRAWLSQHIGDLGNLETLEAFDASVRQFCEMYRVRPAVVAIDAHPGYLGSRWARSHYPALIVEVQHHHAHVASVMAEHHVAPGRPVIGMAFDGTGYGDDGTIWGGEILEATAAGYHRVGHLSSVPLPGGDAAVRHPWRAALTHLNAAGIRWDDDLPPVRHASSLERGVLDHQLSSGLACVPTTSMGRLFDAVSSLLGVRHDVTYEAQAAIELEQAAVAGGDEPPSLRFAWRSDGTFDAAPVLAGLVAAIRRGTSIGSAALAFHAAVAEVVVTAAQASRARTGASTVVLAGGVWQNALLCRLARHGLGQAGFEVLANRIVPSNDAGLALGQLFIAAHRTTPAKET